jgi:hypothetical protein
MIPAADLYRYFKVRDIVTGRAVWTLGGDTRYPAGPGAAQERPWDHREHDTEGEFALVRFGNYPRGYLVRLEEIEPLPDGAGMYHPDHLSGQKELQLRMTYEGSWRQYADQEARKAATR